MSIDLLSTETRLRDDMVLLARSLFERGLTRPLTQAQLSELTALSLKTAR